MFLLLIHFLFLPLWLCGQSSDVCTKITDCSELKLEIVRVNHAMTSGCTSSNQACNQSNHFSQATYQVYLRYIPNVLPSQFEDFYLDYSTLNVTVELESSGQLSHINMALSEQLTKFAHSEWNFDQKVILEAGKNGSQSLTVNFQNTDNIFAPCSGEVGEKILFKWGSATDPIWPPHCVQPCQSPNPSQKCAFAHLMTVVVNAYPGEIISLDGLVGHYVPYDKVVGVPCDPIPIVNTQNTNQQHNGIWPLSVPAANTHTGTANTKLRTRFANQQNTSAGTTIDIEIFNSGANIDPNLSVSYVEFVVKMVHIGAEQPVSLSVPARIVPTVEANGLKSKLLYFVLPIDPAVLLQTNSANYHKLVTITLGKTDVANASYKTRLTTPDSLASRVVTDMACTSLPANLNPYTLTTSGDPECGFANIVKFTLKGEPIGPNDGCNDPKYVTFGLKTDQPPQTMQVEYLKFVLDFEWTDGIVVDGVMLDDFDCPSAGACALTAEFGPAPSLNKRFTYEIAMTGAGKVLNLNPDALMQIKFSGGGCIKGAKLIYLEMRRVSETSCVPDYESTYMGFPICIPGVSGSLKTETDQGLEDGEIHYQTSCTPDPGCGIPPILYADEDGHYRNCPCDPCENFTLIPKFNYAPLNGVSTFDLVLISKHILGLESLPTPYRIIAADANRSGSVSTFDIVLFRKLILGIDDTLSGNTSWRFVLKSFVFPEPDNPFKTSFPVEGSVNPSADIYETEFVAIKVGDVNNSANARPQPRPVAGLSWDLGTAAQSGDVLTVPVRYVGERPMEAIQMGLRFDPAVLSLISPSKGDLPACGADNFNLSRAAQGEIKMLWTFDMKDPERLIAHGDVLFYLTFKVLSPLPESGLPLQLDDVLMNCAAWQPDGMEYALAQDKAEGRYLPVADVQDALPFRAVCQPNPSSGEGMVRVWAEKAAKGRLFLYDAFGNRLGVLELAMQPGEQTFLLPGSAALPAGVYLWRVQSEGKKVQGRWVKQ